MIFDFEKTQHEDDLSEYMTDEQYTLWFNVSYIDGVRIGPKVYMSKEDFLNE
jgi:hypothetical protein